MGTNIREVRFGPQISKAGLAAIRRKMGRQEEKVVLAPKVAVWKY